MKTISSVNFYLDPVDYLYLLKVPIEQYNFLHIERNFAMITLSSMIAISFLTAVMENNSLNVSRLKIYIYGSKVSIFHT